MTNSRAGTLNQSAESGSTQINISSSGSEKEYHKRDLEDYIETLRRLDEQRKDSGKQRDEGVDVIKHWLKAKPTERTPFSPDTVSRYARIIEYLHRNSAIPPDDLKKLTNDLKNYLNVTASSGKSVLQQLKENNLSLLLAVELLQTFLAVPGDSYSKPAMLCYYYIIREIYTADAPLWRIGGARAQIASSAKESPYVTYQCVQSIQRFIEYQQHTASYIACVRDYQVQTQRLEREKAFVSDWVIQEKKRLNYSCFITLQQCCKTLTLPFDAPSDPEKMEGYCEKTLEQLKTAANDVAQAFGDAVSEINAFWKWELGEWSKDTTSRQKDREQFGHARAKSTIELAQATTKNVINELSKDGAPADAKLKAVQDALERAAQETRKAIQPAIGYLEAVVDHELAAATNPDHSWDPAQLAVAASSLASGPDKRWCQDWRISEAVSLQLHVRSRSDSVRAALSRRQKRRIPFSRTSSNNNGIRGADPANAHS
jgi:hypothetical protein